LKKQVPSYGNAEGVNAAPLAAVADGFNTPLSTSTNLNVLANDIYSNLTSVTVSLPAGQTPAHGTASVNTDQSILYTPTSGYSGAQIPVTNGAHTITSFQPVGVQAYGLGDYDAYGYFGGIVK
jgi:hypothetical protein